ncbi:MAG: HD domain-containing protein [Clostridia bacterium]|nr:HD domain-containing protein [Clostridia bacterium]
MNYNSKNFKEFYSIISDMDKHPAVQEMKKYRQHCDTSCYDHCLSVAYYCYCICKKLHLDTKSMARAAFVHDLFLYNWRVRQPGREGLHAFTHARTSYEKASNIFNFNKKEKDIILKHMWPVTPIPPKYIESYILTLVDKYSALEETYTYYSKKFCTKKIYKFASFILPILFIHIP